MIIINRTGFTEKELVEQFEKQVPKQERERTVSRFKSLIYSPALDPANQKQQSLVPKITELSESHRSRVEEKIFVNKNILSLKELHALMVRKTKRRFFLDILSKENRSNQKRHTQYFSFARK